MIAKLDAHQIEDSLEADRRDFAINVIAGDITLRFFESLRIVIGGEVEAFVFFTSWSALKGQRLWFTKKHTPFDLFQMTTTGNTLVSFSLLRISI